MFEDLDLNNGIAALLTAESTSMRKQKGERDTEFVKRIVQTYFIALEHLNLQMKAALRKVNES